MDEEMEDAVIEEEQNEMYTNNISAQLVSFTMSVTSRNLTMPQHGSLILVHIWDETKIVELGLRERCQLL